MTLPISGSQVANDYQILWNELTNLKSDCLIIQQGTTGGAAVSLQYVLQMAQDALVYINSQTAFSSNQTLANGIVAWAQAQAPGSTFSATDFTNTFNAANALITAISSQYPVDAQGKLADRTWNPTTGVVWATATSAQMPTIMTAITNFLATLS